MLRFVRPFLMMNSSIQQSCYVPCLSYMSKSNFNIENKESHQIHGSSILSTEHIQSSELLGFKRYSVWSRMVDTLKKSFIPKNHFDQGLLMQSANILYVICAEYPEFEKFVKTLELPDTLHSWFCITTIHMWLCCFRLRNEGEDFKIFHQKMFDVMADDLTERIKSFPGIGLKRRKYEKFLTGMYFMFFIQMDIAIMSGRDDVMAELIWNLIYQQNKSTKPENLEILIRYIYCQLQHLETFSTEDILCKGVVSFTPLETLTHNEEFSQKRLKVSLQDIFDK